MTNKEYKNAKEIYENADELFTFEHANGFWTSRNMTNEDMTDLRREYKEDTKTRKAVKLEGSNGKAVIIPINNGYKLKSYYTDVCEIVNGEFTKLWEGFSVTTMKHINLFRNANGLASLSKREWIEL